MIKQQAIRTITLGILLLGECLSSVALSEVQRDSRVLASDLIMYSRPYPVISPDGNHVAYISRGYVCVVGVDVEQPRNLFQVPDSWTHFLALPENSEAKGDFTTLAKSKNREEYRAMLKRIKKTFFGLQWTNESDGVAFGVQSHDPEANTTSAEVYLAPLLGEVRKISSAKSPISGRGIGGNFRLTRDQRFLVMTSKWKRPLIWDVQKNQPKATCFLNLTPSSTSDRWIAVEKDTRQLVITDSSFSITKRFDVTIPENKHGYKLHWSPDERFIISRTQIGFDHYSQWEGFHLDLQTNERRDLKGDYMGEQIQFTGNQGEFIRVGVKGKQRGFSGLARVGAYFQIVPTGKDKPEFIWRVQVDAANPKDSRYGFQPPLIASPNFNLFTIGLPRAEGPHGTIVHLLDRHRKLWKLSLQDNGEYFSPYHVVGFAKQGKVIIGHEQNRLLATPVASIQLPENSASIDAP